MQINTLCPCPLACQSPSSRLTSSGSFGLLVRLTDWDDRVYEAHYDNFQVEELHSDEFQTGLLLIQGFTLIVCCVTSLG